MAAVTILSLAAGCKNEGNANDAGATGEKGTYTVNLKTQGGMALSGIDVYVYADDSLADMKQFGQTNEKGTITFDLPKSDKYAIGISGVPKGYDVKQSYELTLTLKTA